MRLILAKNMKDRGLKHIAGTFETHYENCFITTVEEQEAGTYYAYVEMDQLTDQDKFSV